MLKKLDAWLHAALLWACGLLMFGMMTIIFSQVVARYVFHQSLSWSEEVGRYVFVWITFLGLAAAFKSGSHVALDLLVKAVGPRFRRGLEILNGVLVVVLASSLLLSGIRLLEFGMRQRSPALGIPMSWVYIVEPVSGAILLYFSVRALWACASGARA
ncbi:Tripartite ATP-independent periplasmic transporter DctQ component [uncultured Alphaproteobacteria bacterium]|uniref:TRAP transporter small permease protein n=1 Tax=uncultured Alphaproteobacteria bacterium TaxID=91750 RepID=A0A212J1L4_9PROT|nr:Tripartite ATP-independent periplasmic transporter DctQ component [uncultured Alphaproteobacteria bacterium]